MKMVCQPRTKNQRRNQVQMKLDVSSLAHTKWECKYHMLATNVFIPYALIPYYGEKAILPNFRKRKTLQFKKDCNAF